MTSTSTSPPAPPLLPPKKICDTVLDVIGNTPLVRLNRIGQDLPCEILVKCEFFNAGGSVKDRIGKQMVLDAEASGRIQPGDVLIEPTSGNTGIGLALCAAVKGYRCIITMPEKMSNEKVVVLKALGAEIIRTPTEAAFDAPDSHISVAQRLRGELCSHPTAASTSTSTKSTTTSTTAANGNSNSNNTKETVQAHILDQYKNPSNPEAHYHGTAQELLHQCDGKIDMLVAGAGTGGTISGIAKRLKEHNPEIVIVGVDPVGSILAEPDEMNAVGRLEPYHVEGIGYDFVPDVLDRSLVDQWYKSNDRDSLVMMRRLIRDEGLLCGGSSGAAVACALQAAATLQAGQRCVVILPDSVRNYMTKALSDDWMSDHGFVDGRVIQKKQYQTWWATKKVHDLPCVATTSPVTITRDVSCKDAICLLKQEGFDMVPVLDDSGAVCGVVTEGNMTNRILSGRCQPETTVADAGVMYKTFHKFSMMDTLSDIAQALDHDPFVLIVTEQRCFTTAKKRKNNEMAAVEVRSVVSGIVSRIDLLDYISSGESTPLKS